MALYSLLRCPQTQSPLRPLGSDELERLNQRIAGGRAVDGRGHLLAADATLDEGLVTEDGRFVYPVRRNVPVLLLADRIVLSLEGE